MRPRPSLALETSAADAALSTVTGPGRSPSRQAPPCREGRDNRTTTRWSPGVPSVPVRPSPPSPEIERIDLPAGRGSGMVLRIMADDDPDQWVAAARARIDRLLERRSRTNPSSQAAVAYIVVLPADEDRPDGWRPRCLKIAIEAMEADPAYPYSVAELAERSGVSVRTLQEAFRRHVGAGPAKYLRDLRLTGIHGDLLASVASQVTVTDIATRWGWTHHGRLAAAYRARYGVSPKVTLRLHSDGATRPSSGDGSPEADRR